MSRETSPYVVGEFWLDKRRDGKSPDVWQIARSEARSIIYKSTRCRTADLEGAVAAILAHVADERSKGRQTAEDAAVAPILWRYWIEKGRHNINSDQTGRSLRTFIAFMEQDDVGDGAVLTDMLPIVFDRFRAWRMKPHGFSMQWDGEQFDYSSDGVSGDTVNRNLNDIRAAFGHAEENRRIPYAPKVKAVAKALRNPPRERVLTEDELARIVWYAFHFPPLFRFVALQLCTSVRPVAARQFDPAKQYSDRTGLINLQPDATPQTAKRHAIIPAIRPMRAVLRAWAREPHAVAESNKTAWRVMRKALGLSADVFPKTIRHTVATWLYEDDSVPDRQIQAMLGHEPTLGRTSLIYAKYNPARLRKAIRALTIIWLRTSRQARAYGADHRLTIGRNEQGKYLARKVIKR